MNNIYNIYTQNFEMVILSLAGLALIFSLLSMMRVRGLTKKYNLFMKELSGKNIENLLIEHMKSIEVVSKEIEELRQKIEEVKNTTKSCFQKHGIIRYTAFDDVGSDLSFAIALLDGNNDGVILNGIYAREGSSMYAKPVHNGETKHHLSEEEQKALENAKRK